MRHASDRSPERHGPPMINPVNMTFVYWAHTLIQDFPRDIMPIVNNESEWRNFGNIMCNSPSFAKKGTPNTLGFNHWRDWAAQVYRLFGNGKV